MRPILESINFVLEQINLPKQRIVYVDKNLSEKEGIQKVIRKALRKYGGDYRGCTYNPKTGKGIII